MKEIRITNDEHLQFDAVSVTVRHRQDYTRLQKDKITSVEYSRKSNPQFIAYGLLLSLPAFGFGAMIINEDRKVEPGFGLVALGIALIIAGVIAYFVASRRSLRIKTANGEISIKGMIKKEVIEQVEQELKATIVTDGA